MDSCWLNLIRIFNLLCFVFVIFLTSVDGVQHLGGYVLFGFYIWFVMLLLFFEIFLMIKYKRHLKKYLSKNKLVFGSLISSICTISFALYALSVVF